MTPHPALAAIAVAVIWGANFVVIDAGLHDMPPLTFVARCASSRSWCRPSSSSSARTPAGATSSLSACSSASGSSACSTCRWTSAGCRRAWPRSSSRCRSSSPSSSPPSPSTSGPPNAQQLGVLIGLVGLTVVALGRTADTPLARTDALPRGRPVLGHRQRRHPGRSAPRVRPVDDRLVRARRPLAARRRTRGGRQRASPHRLGDHRLDPLHRIPLLVVRVRRLEQPADTPRP